MATTARRIGAAQFKARCLALLDEVATTGQHLVVTKHGKPVAKVVPLEDQEPPSLLGSIVREGDLIATLDVDWEADG